MLIEVLGPVRLTTAEGVPVKVAERKLRLLLAALVTAEGEPVSADVLIDRLWGESPPQNPRSVLRAKLSHLRTLLDSALPGARELLERTPAGYRLAVEPDVVDEACFRVAVRRARNLNTPAQTAEALRKALSMWRGEPYGDVRDEVWLEPAIAASTEARGDAIELLVETHVEVGEPQQVIDLANGAVHSYISRERLVGGVMLSLYQVGRQHEALQLFEALRYHLADDLGADPGPRVRELHAQILRQDPALSLSESPEFPASALARTNLPAETAPLIGRRDELDQLDTLLASSRLVTVTGIGGVGKTHLAQHLARARAHEFERGVWFIDLTELTPTPSEQLGSGERIALLTASVLSLPRRFSEGSARGQVGEALGSRAALLVLDNCEHVITEVAAFVAELLRHAAGARVLATSREPLGLPEEQRDDVGTLSTEPGDDDEPAEAVEFFVARARASDPGFVLDGGSTATVTELCRRLDGLPLALELAAARLRGLTVDALLERLSDRLNLLRRPGHGVPRRRQTLRGMIDWSWSLLSETERAVLRRLAVHPGAMGLEAAETICAHPSENRDSTSAERAEVVDALTSLVDRSMVTMISTPAGARYGLLESIAAYAGEKLTEAGERDAVAGRHLDHYLDLARRADRGLRGSAQRDWLMRMEAERVPVRHAFHESVGSQDGERAVALVLGTFWYSWMSGRQADLHGDLAAATALPGPRDRAFASATTLAAALDLGAGGEEARARVTAALAQFGDDAAARAEVQWFAGMAYLAADLHDEGERLVDDAVDLLIRRGMDWEAAVAACQRDWVIVMDRGEPPRGLPDGRDPESVLRAVGDRGYGLALVVGVQYCVAEVEGHAERAADAAERALEICQDMGFWSEAAYWRIVGAISSLRSGDLPSARRRLEEGRALAQQVASQHGLGFADQVESMIARPEGDVDPRRRR
ncbi:BTAD domain-containing putative transcriptional regulator [Brachybacterium sacelli]|uniref:ATPase/DNA-binding SARP family transcriptional activator n=1 Tax=Brachybacterium sacelli TaxID=173364 RepID=A0ABS4X3Q1_9MICO|nr:BTAD domain-containing putative transcriptional regulator [Brachybacterium sacelli]MBP2383080.1 putative ATPase/DNA-binding SARP family transcriptional activator [Brachybacterium sacelli]